MDYTALTAYASIGAAIGQAVAALAVVVSLIYLAQQLRDNTRAMHGAAYHANVANTIAIITPLYTDPQCSSFVHQALRNPSSLSPDDQFRLHCAMLIYARHFDNLLYQHRLGSLEASQWKGYGATLDAWLRFPGFRNWFEKNGQVVSDELRALISQKIAGEPVTHQ